MWALILSAKLVKRRPDGRYIVKKLEDADEAREKASSMSSRKTNSVACTAAPAEWRAASSEPGDITVSASRWMWPEPGALEKTRSTWAWEWTLSSCSLVAFGART